MDSPEGPLLAQTNFSLEFAQLFRSPMKKYYGKFQHVNNKTYMYMYMYTMSSLVEIHVQLPAFTEGAIQRGHGIQVR